MGVNGHDNSDQDSLTARVEALHQAQLELCTRLEELADHLPDRFKPSECLHIAQLLSPTVHASHELEEKSLFPMLLKTSSPDDEIAQSIERLRFEHWEDESTADDLSQYLRELAEHPDDANIDKLSYMLRGLFEGLRRHIAFEREHLLPRIKAKP